MYQAADQDDLWRHLTEEARRNQIFDNSSSVKEIMDTWTLQTGFPVVTVTIDYANQTVEFTQKRFAYIDDSKVKKNEKPDDTLWWIPISYTTSNRLNFDDTKPSSWIRKMPNLVVNDSDIAPEDWILVNIQQTGKR